jgi:hypothetical protein
MKTYHAVPWIEIGGAALAYGVFMLAWLGTDLGTVLSCCDALMTFIGWRLAMGTDLTMAEVYAGASLPAEFAARLVDESIETLQIIRQTAAQLRDPDQQKSLREIARLGGLIVDQLKMEPNKLATSSRFLETYLRGVADVGVRYSSLKERDPDRDHDFTEFLRQASAVCVNQQKAITADAERDLDLDISVLMRRMSAEIRGDTNVRSTTNRN